MREYHVVTLGLLSQHDPLRYPNSTLVSQSTSRLLMVIVFQNFVEIRFLVWKLFLALTAPNDLNRPSCLICRRPQSPSVSLFFVFFLTPFHVFITIFPPSAMTVSITLLVASGVSPRIRGRVEDNLEYRLDDARQLPQ